MTLLPEDPVRRGRVKLALVGLACLAPFFLASVLYLVRWSPGTTSNYGELLQPMTVAVPPFDRLKGRWILVSFDPGACDAACERKLYLMRQIQRAQGREQHRVDRLWVVIDGAAPNAPRALTEGARITSAPERDWSRLFPADGTVRDHLYLIDPIGNLMMRFPGNPDPAGILKDLSRLLRYSGFG
jgi:hypothetical protein